MKSKTLMTPEKWRQFNMLQDVITHFGSDPTLRCVGDGGCIYCPTEELIKANPKNIGCAIGMFLSWKVAKRLDSDVEKNISTVLSKEEYYDLLPKWIRDIDTTFLQCIQNLHDNFYYFSEDDSGFNKDGLNHIKKICSKYKLPFDLLTIPQ